METVKQKLGKVGITVEKEPWSENKEYPRLTIVLRESTNTCYISRKAVPVGTTIDNKEYWLKFSALNQPSYEISQEFGDSSELGISQRTLTEAYNEVKEETNKIPGIEEAITTKQDTIEDLQTIREGASLGSTAQQPQTTLEGYGITDAYTKEEVNNLITTPDQKYVTVEATAETQSAEEALPQEGESDTIYRVGSWDGTQYTANVYSEYAWKGSNYIFLSKKETGIDDEPTADSNNLVKSGGVQKELALGAIYDVSAKNPTAGPNNDGKFESLSALLSDTNLNTLIPTAVRKGGMSIKFVQSSDNKYVQWRLMTDGWSINTEDWERYNDITTSNQPNSDLDIADDSGNVLVRITEGHVKTKNFDSRNVGNIIENDEMDEVLGGEVAVFLTDVDGNAVLE